MNSPKPSRPIPGATVTKEVHVAVCAHCGYAIGEAGMCSSDCEFDGEHGPHDFFHAIWERTDKFIRDEPALDAQGGTK